MYSTIIIGAGPIGSYLANILANSGHSVLVLEKKPDPGLDICCTGIISKECFDHLSLEKEAISRKANSARFILSNGRSLPLCRNHDVAYIVDRPTLNRILATRAQAAGAEYHFASTVADIENVGDHLHIEVSNPKGRKFFAAESAVIATGFGSDLTEKIGLGKIVSFTIGGQIDVTVENVSEVEVYMDRETAPGGFAWLVPTFNGKGLAGLITQRQPDQYLEQFINELRKRNKIISTEGTPMFRPIPNKPLSQTYVDRVLVVGEAAGQVKPTTGGGIYFGLICADIAANVLNNALADNDFSTESFSSYQQQWHTRLKKELTVGYWTHLLGGKLSNGHVNHLLNVLDRRGIGEFIRTTDKFSFDWQSQLIVQLALFLLHLNNIKN